MTQRIVRRLADHPMNQHRGLDLLGNLLLIAAVWFGYSFVRTLTADAFGSAREHAVDLLNFQDAIGLPSELTFQRGLLGQTELIQAANVYYLTVHFPVTVFFLGWVWLRHRPRFTRIRNSLVAITVAGMFLHALYPLAPPRMIPGFVDTAKVFGPNPYGLKVADAANQIAAMPSLHVGWALVVAIGVLWICQSRWKWLILAHPVLTGLVVVATANHYWTDAIVAILLVGIVWAAAVGITAIRRTEATTTKLETNETDKTDQNRVISASTDSKEAVPQPQ